MCVSLVGASSALAASLAECHSVLIPFVKAPADNPGNRLLAAAAFQFIGLPLLQ